MDRRLSKKVLLLTLKYIPWLMAFGYLIGCLLANFGIYSIILTNTVGMSILPFVFFLCCSFALGYCIWHRLPLYYIAIVDIINIIDYLIGIPFSYGIMCSIYLILFGITVLISAYLKNMYNVKQRNLKESIT